MKLHELISLNEKQTRNEILNSKGYDINLLGQYKSRIDYLLNNKEDFAQEMSIFKPVFSDNQEENKDTVIENYREFAISLSKFFKYLMDNKNIKLKTALKIYNWPKITDKINEKIFTQLVKNLIKKAKV